MFTPGHLPTPTEAEKAQRAQTPRGSEMTHVERHYKSIGISAIASALSVLKRGADKTPAMRDTPAFLRKENIAA